MTAPVRFCRSGVGKMASTSGTSCRAGLLLILVVCSFARVAVGRGVATEDDVVSKLRESGGADGAVGVEDGVTVDAAGGDKSAGLSDHSEVGLCFVGPRGL
jgi:hypothetical protein